jgi:predicted DNA-binding WGR domain protein
MLRRFEFVDEKSNKFWEISLSGPLVSVKFGRIGTDGQIQTKSFSSDAEAQSNYDKLIAEKKRKGYQEVASAAEQDFSVKQMDESLFWKVIHDSKRGSEGDIEAQLESLEEKLQKLDDGNLVRFKDLTDEKIARSNRWDLWAAAYYDNDGCSDDGFEYWRAGLVLSGKKAYESVLAHPDNLANFEVTEAEELSYIPTRVWEERHPATPMPSNFNLADYPDLEGDAFDEDDAVWFAKTFPKLTKKKGVQATASHAKSSQETIKKTPIVITIACERGTPEYNTAMELCIGIRHSFGKPVLENRPKELVITALTDNVNWATRRISEILNSVAGDHNNVKIIYGAEDSNARPAADSCPSPQIIKRMITLVITCKENTPEYRPAMQICVAILHTFGAPILDKTANELIIKFFTDDLDSGLQKVHQIISLVPGDHNNIQIVHDELKDAHS